MSDVPTLEEWIQSNQHIVKLESNVRTNLEVYGVSEDDIEALTRLEMIMFRQCFDQLSSDKKK